MSVFQTVRQTTQKPQRYLDMTNNTLAYLDYEMMRGKKTDGIFDRFSFFSFAKGLTEYFRTDYRDIVS